MTLACYGVEAAPVVPLTLGLHCSEHGCVVSHLVDIKTKPHIYACRSQKGLVSWSEGAFCLQDAGNIRESSLSLAVIRLLMVVEFLPCI